MAVLLGQTDVGAAQVDLQAPRDALFDIEVFFPIARGLQASDGPVNGLGVGGGRCSSLARSGGWMLLERTTPALSRRRSAVNKGLQCSSI